MSFRKITICARGSWPEPVTAVVRTSTGPPRYVTQSLLLQLRGVGTVKGAFAPRMSTSSTVGNNKEKQDGQASLDRKSGDEYGSVLMQVLDEKKEPKQLTAAGKGAFVGPHKEARGTYVANHLKDRGLKSSLW